MAWLSSAWLRNLLLALLVLVEVARGLGLIV